MNEHKTETSETVSASIRTYTKSWQIIIIALASFLGAFLIVDILSISIAGIFSLFGFIVVPAVFAYPIVIGKPKLLLLPIGIISLSFTAFYIRIYPELIPYLLIFMGIFGGLGMAVGRLIRWFRSADRKKQISFLSIIVISVLSVTTVFFSGMIASNW